MLMFSAKLFTIVSAVLAVVVNGSPIGQNGTPANNNGTPTGATNGNGNTQNVRDPRGPPDVDDGEM